MLKLEEMEEPRNGRLLRSLLGCCFKDEIKQWIKALITVESLSRIVVDLIKFWTLVTNIYYLEHEISWNHIFPLPGPLFFGSFPLFLMLMVSAIVGMVNPIHDIQENRWSPYGLPFLSKDQGFWIPFLAIL